MPRTICTSMRITDGINASLVMTNDLARKRREILNRIDHLMRTTTNVDQLRAAIAREMAVLAIQERDILNADKRRREEMSRITYADESEG